MTLRTREAAYQALFNLGLAAYPWLNSPARTKKLVLWDGVPAEQRPSFYQFEGGDEAYTWTQGAVRKRIVPARWFIYLNASSIQQSPTVNAIMDALDAALFAGVAAVGQQTLGGTCEWCRIVGPVLREPGDLDGDGILMVPLEICLP